MKGYKVFNPDWSCRGFQYKVGETYEMNDKPWLCKRGFHFCDNLVDLFKYYWFSPYLKIAEVEAVGDIDYSKTKCCTNKIKIVREIPFENLEISYAYKQFCSRIPYAPEPKLAILSYYRAKLWPLTVASCKTQFVGRDGMYFCYLVDVTIITNIEIKEEDNNHDVN